MGTLGRRRFFRAVLWIVAASAMVGTVARGAGETPRRVERPEPVIAAYLVNFARYVTWPSDSGAAGAPLVLAVVGPDTFEGALERAAEGRTASGRPMMVRKARTVADLGAAAHVVFFAPEAAKNALPAPAMPPGALTVGIGPGFLEAGGMVELIVREGRMTFAIDLRRAEAAGLSISARMLAAAAEVRR